LCADNVIVFSVFQKRKTETESELFQIDFSKGKKKNHHHKRWKQYFADRELVFFYFCDESRERSGNVGRVFGLSDYHDYFGLFYFERQIE